MVEGGVLVPLLVTLLVSEPVPDTVADGVTLGVGDDDTLPLALPVIVTDAESVDDMVGVGVTDMVSDTDGDSETLMDGGADTIPLVPPFPSSPYVSSPQQETAPAVVSAHVCRMPVARVLTFVITGEDGGLSTWLGVPPFPN